MRLISGDECGLLKEVIPELGRKKKDPNALIQPHSAMIDVTTTGMARVDPKEPQKRDRGVVDMVWLDEGDDSSDNISSSFSVLRKNGSVDIWSTTIEKANSFGQYSLDYATSTNIFGTKENPRPLGLGFFQQQNRSVAGDMLGNIVVLDAKNKNKCDIIESYNSYTTSKGGSTISYTPGKQENVQLATAIGFDTVRGRVAVGGREREVCLTDIATGKLVFKTKNMPPDPQTLLQQPVWPTAIQFLNTGSNLMAVGTAYKQVRLYDVRESSKTRRPTMLTPEGLFEYRCTSLCQIDENELVVGDASGDILTLDIRRLGRNAKGAANRDLPRFAGPAGSVRQLKKHPTLPRLVAVGLDRMLRVYDTNTRKQLDCVYLKQRLSSVLIHRRDNLKLSDDTGIISDDDEYDTDDVDMDQDDVVRDYVDSDDEIDNDSDEEDDESEEEDQLEKRGKHRDSYYCVDSDNKINNDSESQVNNSSDSEEADDNEKSGSDDSEDEDDDSENVSVDEETSEEEISGQDDEESEEEGRLEKNPKRRRQR